ncbi:ADYC domain-containing protein [Roseomonas rosulenta]|uniref:ADYC domain-containing protein n=1 Tax=Roseomonas rosulenta TaxID=2748667 RepID=UPI0018DF5113|nr:ADYC domain-containing protein [Roseomonas rosulenta]
MFRRSLAILLLAATAASAEAVAPQPVALSAERGDFRLEWSDGTVTRGASLVGARLMLAGEPVTITAARPSPHDRLGEIWQFDLRRADGSRYCTPDPHGEQWAMTLPDPEAPGGFSITCTSGGLGKCLNNGYAPWRQTADGQSLAAYHRACLHMLRAAYGGGEHGWTRNGTRIDMFDDAGIVPDDEPSDTPFEAGWNEHGAVCVAHPRIPENGSLDDILAETPHLAGRLGPAACTEERARALGALVFNRSR